MGFEEVAALPAMHTRQPHDLKELSQNVITFAQAKPELRGTWVVAALLLYLQSLCGLVPK
jgi:hypothetical protein